MKQQELESVLYSLNPDTYTSYTGGKEWVWYNDNSQVVASIEKDIITIRSRGKTILFDMNISVIDIVKDIIIDLLGVTITQLRNELKTVLYNLNPDMYTKHRTSEEWCWYYKSPRQRLTISINRDNDILIKLLIINSIGTKDILKSTISSDKLGVVKSTVKLFLEGKLSQKEEHIAQMELVLNSLNPVEYDSITNTWIWCNCRKRLKVYFEDSMQFDFYNDIYTERPLKMVLMPEESWHVRKIIREFMEAKH